MSFAAIVDVSRAILLICSRAEDASSSRSVMHLISYHPPAAQVIFIICRFCSSIYF
jgi:hypothetical protein